MCILEQYKQLEPQAQEFIDGKIMDSGINSLKSLLKALDMAKEYIGRLSSIKKSFEDFQSARTMVTLSADDSENAGYPRGVSDFLVYPDDCKIQIIQDGFYLIIETNEWVSNDLESLEWILYNRWYLHC